LLAVTNTRVKLVARDTNIRRTNGSPASKLFSEGSGFAKPGAFVTQDLVSYQRRRATLRGARGKRSC